MKMSARVGLCFLSSVNVINLARRRTISCMNNSTATSSSSEAKTEKVENMRAAISKIRARITAAAAKRDEQEADESTRNVTLIAVSKTKAVELVKACRDAGQLDFGENYVQEMISKAALLPRDIRWHFIGALQTNKASALLEVENLAAVHSVDREKVARALQRAAVKVERAQLDVMVQVNVDDEESKAGCALADVDRVVDIVQECDRLQLVGLMCIGRAGNVDAFRTLRRERDRVALRLGMSAHSLQLSMGMSADFESAVANGSNIVRVGSLIFGARTYPPSTTQ